MSIATLDMKPADMPRTFTELVALHEPRPIRDDAEHEQTVELIDLLMRVKRPTKDQAAFAQTLTLLVQDYEARHHAGDLGTVSGLTMLRTLVEEHGLNGADLSRLLGASRALGPMILRGDRSLTADHARKLGQHFKLDPGVFIR